MYHAHPLDAPDSANATAPTNMAADAPRLLYVDHLRNAVILGLIVFHTARLFDRDPWHLKHAETYLAADLLISAFNIVQMPLLFLLAGMTLHLSLDARGAGQFLQERFLKLLLPLVVGILVVVPPQVWAERIAVGVSGRMSPIDFTADLLDFYPTFFTCCYPAANFSWHHLWFLVYLLAYSALLLPVFLGLRTDRGAAFLATLGRWLATGHRTWLLALPLIAVEVLLRPIFPQTHALIDDWANHSHYMLLMLIGGLVAARPDLRAALQRTAPLYLGTAAVLIALWLIFRAVGFQPEIEWRLLHRGLAEWSAMAGLLGWASRYLARPLPFLTAFSRFSFPFYVFHQTAIVLLGLALLGWTGSDWLGAGLIGGAFTKFAVIASLSGLTSLFLAWLVGQTVVTRLMFGLRK